MQKPYIPYVGREYPDRLEHFRLYGLMAAHFGIFVQLITAALCVFGWLSAGASRRPLIMGVIVAILVAIWIDSGILRELRSKTPKSRGGYFAWSYLYGWACLGVVGAAFVSIVGRVSTMAVGIFFYFLLLLIIAESFTTIYAIDLGPAIYDLWLADRRRHAWILICIGISLVPAVVGWAVASFDIQVSSGGTHTIRAWIDEHSPMPRPCAEWVSDGKPIKVAVTLSGGGYRAAVSQAGLLAALNDQCVPIDILSTVSGGSIVGAAYTLGVPPREFATMLADHRPGLPDDLLSMFNIPVGVTRKYQRHYRRVFFGDHTIRDLPDLPKLLINVTNIDSTPDTAREFITNNWAPREADDTRIADAVAASAAFPGVFGPVQFPWKKPERDGEALTAHFLIDGGVVENWGVEGLRQYLRDLRPDQWDRDHPSILIVSDASFYGQRPYKTPDQPPIDEAVFMIDAIQFANSQRLTLAELTGVENLSSRISTLPAWQQYTRIGYPHRYMPDRYLTKKHEDGPSSSQLATIVVPITAVSTAKLLNRYSLCAGPSNSAASDVQERVRSLSSLEELTPVEIEDAFWLGYTLGNIYGQAIECARRDIEGSPCSSQPNLPVVRCPPPLRP
jgi:hypothetical protein